MNFTYLSLAAIWMKTIRKKLSQQGITYFKSVWPKAELVIYLELMHLNILEECKVTYVTKRAT